MARNDGDWKLDRRKYLELAGLTGLTGLAGCSGGGGGGGGGGDSDGGGGGGGGSDGGDSDGGGGGDGGSDGGDSGGSSSGGSLTVWAWNDQALAPIRKEQSGTFEEQEGSSISWQYFPWDNYLTKLQSSIAAGNAPEAFALATVWIPKLGDAGRLAELDPNNFPELVGAARRNSVYDGTLYSVPWYCDVRCLCINVDMFEEAGLEVPSDKTQVPSWDQFSNWVNTLSTGDRKGYAMAPDEGFEGMMLSNGGNYLEDLDGGGMRASMADDQVVEAANYFMEDLDLQNNVLLNDEDLEQFLAGNAAMTYAGSWELAQLNSSDINYAYLPHPSGPSGDTSHTWSAGVYYSVPSEPTGLQRKFMDFILSKEQQLKVIDTVGGFPGRADVYETEEFQNIIEENPVMEVIAQEMQKAVPLPRIPNGVEALNIFRPAIERVWQGQTDPATAFQQADEKAAAQLDAVTEA